MEEGLLVDIPGTPYSYRKKTSDQQTPKKSVVSRKETLSKSSISSISTNNNISENRFLTVDIPLKNGNTFFISTDKKTNKVIFGYVFKAPPITKIVLSGGGAKGVFYAGVFEALQKKGILNYLKEVAGASIGAITSSFLACGMDPEEFKNSAKNEDYEKLLHEDTEDNKNPFLGKNGKPMLEFIEKNLKNSILKYINSNYFKNLNLDNIKFRDEKEKKYFEKLQKDVQSKILQQNDVLSPTFSHLAALRQMAPETFKDLTITAVCVEKSETIYFNLENTPNLEIALACRASASLPIFLDPVVIDNNKLGEKFQGKSGSSTFIDGGYFDNTPIYIPGQNEEKNKSLWERLKTLVFVFDEKSSYINIKDEKNALIPTQSIRLRASAFHTYNPSLVEKLLRDDLVEKKFNMSSEIPSTETEVLKLKEIQKDYTLRTIPIPTGEISTVSFKEAREQADQRIKEGYLTAMEYLENHKYGFAYHDSENIYEILLFIPLDEIQELKYIYDVMPDQALEVDPKVRMLEFLHKIPLEDIINFRKELEIKISQSEKDTLKPSDLMKLIPAEIKEDNRKIFETHIISRLKETGHYSIAGAVEKNYPIIKIPPKKMAMDPLNKLLVQNTLRGDFPPEGKLAFFNVEDEMHLFCIKKKEYTLFGKTLRTAYQFQEVHLEGNTADPIKMPKVYRSYRTCYKKLKKAGDLKKQENIKNKKNSKKDLPNVSKIPDQLYETFKKNEEILDNIYTSLSDLPQKTSSKELQEIKEILSKWNEARQKFSANGLIETANCFNAIKEIVDLSMPQKAHRFFKNFLPQKSEDKVKNLIASKLLSVLSEVFKSKNLAEIDRKVKTVVKPTCATYGKRLQDSSMRGGNVLPAPLPIVVGPG